MEITIRPNPDCIELIRSEFEELVIRFLKSVGILEKDAKKWEAIHTTEINEKTPPLVDVFNMKCFLPYELFAKTDWLFKFEKEGFFTSFIISGHVVCCKFLHTAGLKYLPKNLLNLDCSNYQCENLDENFEELKKFLSLKKISFKNCTKLKNISLIGNLVNLQTFDLSGCKSITNLSCLSGLINLQTLDLRNCKSLTDISGISGLLNLQSLNLSFCKSLTDISGISGLLNLQSLNLSHCESLTDISSLAGLLNLQSINLDFCKSLTDISSLAELLNLQSLKFHCCKSLTDISSLAGLLNLKSLNLSGCESLSDISSLAGLLNLQSLDLSNCRSLTDINSLSKLFNLQTLDLSICDSLSDISSLAGLFNLQSLDLNGFESLSDISSLAGLLNLKSLKLRECKSLTDIITLARLPNLQTLDLSRCESLTDVNILYGLVNLQSLDLSICDSLSDRSSLAGLLNLQSLNLNFCKSLTDIRSLSGLLNLQSLNLSDCNSLTDISSLSGLLNLRSLNLSDCNSLTDISSLSGLVSLQSLDLENCKRLQNYSPLKKCLALKELQASTMHPAVLSEILCFLAVQRKDIPFISEKADSWLQELELGFDQKHSSTNDLACSLAKGIVLANLEVLGLSFYQTLLNHPNVGIVPWKIWFSENLKTFGWDKIQKLAELNKPSELTFGAIGGISSCLPSLEGAPVQIAWAKKWISEIHSLHNNNPNFLKPAAAEWCLALKRLGEDELLREWIEKFTDPSDPSALDPINKVFSAYALDLNDSESALEYALKINDPKLRDESILNLALQFIKEGETSKAGEFLFLLTQVESRTQLAYTLAEDAAYLKIDENAHRLLAACGDSPQSLANILDKLRLANPDSEILKIMHEKLSDESRSEIPASLIMQTSNNYTNTLLKIKDPSQLVKIQQAIDSIMKSS